eukprot:TRINITY_DN4708_c0_g1_i3.p1 TRINITY_DN4708_c0_g1~~TRINITY_DN4708_c0_g1_i3.p1  ORF type:complete len:138 (+),score=33.54 TRINITY_DN4708_c0_g1_i3:688-1101(+)
MTFSLVESFVPLDEEEYMDVELPPLPKLPEVPKISNFELDLISSNDTLEPNQKQSKENSSLGRIFSLVSPRSRSKSVLSSSNSSKGLKNSKSEKKLSNRELQGSSSSNTTTNTSPSPNNNTTTSHSTMDKRAAVDEK